MTTHELLGKECMSFSEWHGNSHECVDIISDCRSECQWAQILDYQERAHSFLTQSLTPEWVNKYLDLEMEKGGRFIIGNVLLLWNKRRPFLYYRQATVWLKHPSHLFESLPSEMKLTYKNVEI